MLQPVLSDVWVAVRSVSMSVVRQDTLTLTLSFPALSDVPAGCCTALLAPQLMHKTRKVIGSWAVDGT